jgi:hypothetical protein
LPVPGTIVKPLNPLKGLEASVEETLLLPSPGSVFTGSGEKTRARPKKIARKDAAITTVTFIRSGLVKIDFILSIISYSCQVCLYHFNNLMKKYLN